MAETPHYADLHHELRAHGYTNTQIASVVNSPDMLAWIKEQLGPPVEVPPKVKPLLLPSPANPAVSDVLVISIAAVLTRQGIRKLHDLESKTARELEEYGLSKSAIHKIRQALRARGRHLEGEF